MIVFYWFVVQSNEEVASDLLDDDIDFVTVLHVEFFGSLGFVEPLSVEKESYVCD